MTTLTMRSGDPAPVVVVDYGKDIGGVPHLVVQAATGAPTLRVAYSEGLSYLSTTGDGGGSFSATAAPTRFADFTVTGPVALTGQVQGGERYQLFTLTTPGSVTLRRVSIHFTALRAGPSAYHGWFLCSSELLNRIWYAGAYTTQLDQLPPRSLRLPTDAASNRLALIMDGAKRDRKVWAGDLTVEGPNILYSTDASSYFRDSLALLTSYQEGSGQEGGRMEPEAPVGSFPSFGTVDTGPIYSASYSMDVVLGIASYYRFSGDLAFVRSQWPNIVRELAWNRSLVDGRNLLVTSNVEGLDWDYYDGAKTGAVTTYNAIYVQTLRDAAELADAVGRHGSAAAYRAQAQKVVTAINRYLWNSGVGAYPVSDTRSDTVAEDGNALAVLYGIVPHNDVPTVLATMRRTLWTTPYGPLPYSSEAGFKHDISPFAANLEVQARFAAGDAAGALALIGQLWGQMLTPGPNDTGTFWEVLGADGAPALGGFTSLAHGWASGPTSDLSAYVLGIVPQSAGFRTWVVAPHPGPLLWAEGQAPTPFGPIHVRWVAGSRGTLNLEVTAPAGTNGTVEVPIASRTAEVTEDGRRVTPELVTSLAGPVTAEIAVRGGAETRIGVSPIGG